MSPDFIRAICTLLSILYSKLLDRLAPRAVMFYALRGASVAIYILFWAHFRSKPQKYNTIPMYKQPLLSRTNGRLDSPPRRSGAKSRLNRRQWLEMPFPTPRRLC